MDALSLEVAGVSLPVISGGYIPGPEHPCAKCSGIQKTCCQRAEILITSGDAARIARHTQRDDFEERRRPLDIAYFDQADDPNWIRYTFAEDGTRRVLKRRHDGDCTFLGPKGCTLPTDVRPLVCRLYPFTYVESGITGVEGEYCPVPRVVPPGQSLVETLGMRLEDAVRWHGMLYEELRTGGETDENRPYVRSA